MRSTNHYRTLGVDTDATQDEIRKAYRRLALQHHPDHNNGDPKSAMHFKEIHEAYHILSDPQRRSAYNQATWFYKHALKKQPQPLTPYLIFSKTNELKLFLDKLRPSEINKEALFRYLKQLLSEQSINMLKQSADATLNKEVINNLIGTTASLTAYQTESIAVRLKPIADADTLPLIEQRIKDIRLQKIWEGYHFLIIMMLTLLLCLMIYLLSK